MVSERQGDIRKEYGYDKRGNLTAILENGAWKKQYVYGVMNRLEEAVDVTGKQARYQYNGLGHRVGKQEGVLPKDKLEKLDPQRRVGMEIGNSRQITYILNLTRQYYNLLERTEESQSQRYFWDGNVAAYEENGERNYYLQDELGSPLRLEDSAGTIKESYGYGAFGEDLYQNQGEMQPFGYTGYQRDEIAGTYYAQAREYLAESGRFAGQDLIAGFMDLPFSMNRYSYCFNEPMVLVDLDGALPKWVKEIGRIVNDGIEAVKDVWHWIDESVIHKYIIGNDITIYKTDLYGGTYEVTAHEGGNLFVFKYDANMGNQGWVLNLGQLIPNSNLSLSGKNANISTWKLKSGIKYTDNARKISASGGLYINSSGLGMQGGFNGTSENMPFELPNDIVITNHANLKWSYALESHIANWKQIGEGVISLAAIIAIILLIADNATGVGFADDGALVPLFAYVTSKLPALGDMLQRLFPKLGELCTG